MSSTDKKKDNTKTDEGKLSIRLDEETNRKLHEIMKARGVNKTDAVCMCINEIPILQIGDVKELAKEFYAIRIALENGDNSEELCEEVKKLCHSISELIQKVEYPNT